MTSLNHIQTEWLLFTDGSVNTQTKWGYGAQLRIFAADFAHPAQDLQTHVIVKRFTDTSSTKLELQTLLWALDSIPDASIKLSVYTDSQNIHSLAARRTNFEAHNYHSKKGVPLRNTELYQAYFRHYDRLQFTLFKVKGHKKSAQRNQVDKLFALVDKASRKANRKQE